MEYVNWLEKYEYDENVNERYKLAIYEKAMLSLFGNKIHVWINQKLIEKELRGK